MNLPSLQIFIPVSLSHTKYRKDNRGYVKAAKIATETQKEHQRAAKQLLYVLCALLNKSKIEIAIRK